VPTIHSLSSVQAQLDARTQVVSVACPPRRAFCPGGPQNGDGESVARFFDIKNVKKSLFNFFS